MSVKIVVVGAKGALGQGLLDALAERKVEAASVVLLDSGKAVGREHSYGENGVLRVASLDDFAWKEAAFALFLDESRQVPARASRAVAAGCAVIDLSGALTRSEGTRSEEIPVVAMDVNPEDLARGRHKKKTACPGAAALLAASVLAPLCDGFGVKRAVITSLHSTGEGGREAQDELFRQTRGIFVNQSPSENQTIFPKQIAFNLIPQVGPFVDGGRENGTTEAESALVSEVRAMLGPELRLHAACIQGPLFVGIAQQIVVECQSAPDAAKARAILREAPGVGVVDHRQDGGYATPVDVLGEDRIFVSRIRPDRSVEHGLSLWCVGDMTRLQAVNAVRVLQRMRERG